MGGLSKLLGNRAADHHKGTGVHQKAAPAVASNSSVNWNNRDDDLKKPQTCRLASCIHFETSVTFSTGKLGLWSHIEKYGTKEFPCSTCQSLSQQVLFHGRHMLFSDINQISCLS